MCLAIPAQIISMNNNIARVRVGKGERDVKCVLSEMHRGDWVLVNADLALEKISKKEALEFNQLFIKAIKH